MEVPLKYVVTTTTFIMLSLALTNMPSPCFAASTTPTPRRLTKNKEFLRKSCHTTMYPRLCYRSLSRHSHKIRTSHKRLASTALAVTFSATRSTSRKMKNFTKIHGLKPRESAAIRDCVEELGDSVYELRKSIKEFNVSGGPKFRLQMNDIQTWVSAALTDDDTCVDGFAEVRRRSRVKKAVRRLVLRIAHLTSIALAFVSLYAAT